jgi:large subunit ribosomal protein L21
VYAVIETGGKQYKVTVGQTVDVELLQAQVGDKVEFDRVLMVTDNDQVQVGRPILGEAKVAATVLDQVSGPKLIVFKYRAKERLRHKTGHRQHYTRLRIDEIRI